MSNPRMTRGWLVGALVLSLAACEGATVGGDQPGDPLADGGVANNSNNNNSSSSSNNNNKGPMPDGGQLEACDGLDNNGNGQVDEGCVCKSGAQGACYPGVPAHAGVGLCTMGTRTCKGTSEFGAWGACTGAGKPRSEVCGNGVDEDCDGADRPCGSDGSASVADGGVVVTPDQGVPGGCTPGATRTCYSGKPGTVGKGVCKAGTETCKPDRTWGACQGQVTPGKETCGNGVDEDCDGTDPPCGPKKVGFGPFFSDCVYVKCPPATPYPVGCQVVYSFAKNEPRGCVASTPTDSTVYFQAGDQCNAGFVTGWLMCSTKPGAPLSQLNCPMIGKTKYYYVTSPSQCP